MKEERIGKRTKIEILFFKRRQFSEICIPKRVIVEIFIFTEVAANRGPGK